MVPVFDNPRSSNRNDADTEWPENRVLLGAVIGTAAIMAAVAGLARCGLPV